MPTQISYRDEPERSEELVTTLHPYPVKISGPQADDAAGVVRFEEQFQYKNPAGSATTVIKASAGFLHCITINGTAASTITIFDNTAGSGTKIGTMKASIVEASYLYDVAFNNGLTVVLGGASDITVSYR